MVIARLGQLHGSRKGNSTFYSVSPHDCQEWVLPAMTKREQRRGPRGLIVRDRKVLELTVSDGLSFMQKHAICTLQKDTSSYEIYQK